MHWDLYRPKYNNFARSHIHLSGNKPHRDFFDENKSQLQTAPESIQESDLNY